MDPRPVPPSSPKLPASPKDVSPSRDYKCDEIIDNLVANFNSRIDQELELTTTDLIEKFTTHIESRLKFNYALSSERARKADGSKGDQVGQHAATSPSVASERPRDELNTKKNPGTKLYNKFDGNHHHVSITNPSQIH